MAKKTRRVRQPGKRTPMQRPAVSQPVAAPSESTTATRSFHPSALANMPAKVVDFAQEYKYVGRDLRHVGVISVAVLAFLVILAQFV